MQAGEVCRAGALRYVLLSSQVFENLDGWLGTKRYTSPLASLQSYVPTSAAGMGSDAFVLERQSAMHEHQGLSGGFSRVLAGLWQPYPAGLDPRGPIQPPAGVSPQGPSSSAPTSSPEVVLVTKPDSNV